MKELYKGLDDEQRRRVMELASPEEMLAYAKDQGIELSDEQLEAVSGGSAWSSDRKCPDCGSTRLSYDNNLMMFVCQNCNAEF